MKRWTTGSVNLVEEQSARKSGSKCKFTGKVLVITLHYGGVEDKDKWDIACKMWDMVQMGDCMLFRKRAMELPNSAVGNECM